MAPPEQTRTLDSGTSGEPHPTPVWLEAVEGPGAGARLELRNGTVVVGRAPPCELILVDPAVSSAHASIELLGHAVRVRDLGSRNGTRFLGARISEARVPLGGAIQLGATVLQIRPATEELPPSDRERLLKLEGRSLAMRRLFARLERIAPLELPVLLLGETGVGKDAAARALHQLSPRAGGPLVVFDCAATSPSLVESALFGHVRGAFTGAASDRFGAVASAAGGTLYLDEVGELPLELQPRLLRLLESGEFRPVGADRTEEARARVMASSQRDLPGEVRGGRFRRDLLYRLEALTVVVPTLRERREDIPMLIDRFTEELRGAAVRLRPETVAAFQGAEWRGNVRELRNAVHRALALGEEGGLGPAEPAGRPGYREAKEALLQQFERDYLRGLLQEHRGNVSAAARAAGVARMTLYRMLEKHQLVRESSSP